MPLTPGARLGPYEIVGSLGAGGMGEVYRARDTKLDRDIALKVLPLDTLTDSAARHRLVREAKLAGSLNHPSICTARSRILRRPKCVPRRGSPSTNSLTM